jgi:uncharacterized protein (TIGR03435 family)
LEGKEVSMAELVRILAMVLGWPVLNRTGFAGQLDVRVDFSPDESILGLVGAGGPRDPGGFTPPVADPDKPNIFAALQQQLGLRLGASKGPVEVLVIEHVERSAAN